MEIPEKIKYHSTLASYFASKPLYLDEPTQKNPHVRKLVEQPWQQTKGELWDEVTETLSDLLFLEAKCKSGRTYDSLNDFDGSDLLTKIPELKFVRQAVTSSLPGFFLEPEHHLSMLWNHLKWLLPDENTPSVFLTNLSIARQKLMNSFVWLRAIAPLPDAKQFKPHQFPIGRKYIQALTMKTKSLAETDGSSTVDIVDIISGKLIIRKQIHGNDIVGISVSDMEYKIVALDKTGSLYYESTKTEFRARQGESLLEWVKGYVIFAQEDNHLVAWNPEKNEITLLLEDLPKPLIVLRADKIVPGILFVAGYRKQILGTAIFASGEWSVKLLNEFYAPVVAGDIDLKAGLIVFGTADSNLILIDIKSGTILKQSSYQAETGSSLRGMLNRVSFGAGPTEGTIFLATETGQVWNWNYNTGQYSPYCDYKKRKETGSCLSMNVWPDTGLPFVSTESTAMTLVPAESASAINQPVSNICITDDLQVVSASYEGHSVCFYNSEGLIKIKNSMFPWPLALCQTDEPDSVWIGGKTGVSCKIGAVTTDDQNKMTQSSTAIIGIFKSDQPGMRWTAMTNGDIMSGPSIATDVIEDKKRTKVLWSGTGYEKRIKVIPASDHGTFWCLTAIESHQGLTVSLISEKQQALILDEKQYFSDIAISSDFTLFASSGSSIKIFHFEGQQWKLLYSCLDSSKLIAFTGDKKFLVAVHGGWLRVRAISPGLPLITSCHLSGKIICLAVKNRNIAAGLLSGDIVSLILETEAIHIK